MHKYSSMINGLAGVSSRKRGSGFFGGGLVWLS
jgi:hypothetical protein